MGERNLCDIVSDGSTFDGHFRGDDKQNMLEEENHRQTDRDRKRKYMLTWGIKKKKEPKDFHSSEGSMSALKRIAPYARIREESFDKNLSIDH